MRIGLDGRTLTGRFTGDRTYWKNLLAAFTELPGDHEFIVYTRTPIAASELPISNAVTQRVVASPSDRLWTLYALPIAAKSDGIDVLHVQYTIPPKSLCPFPVVTTIHDVSFHLYPEWFGVKNRILLNLTTKVAVRSAARIITVSESSRADIIRSYRLNPDRIVATLPGLPAPFDQIAGQSATSTQRSEQHELARQTIARKHGITSPFFLTVGVLQPRKNHLMLAKAWGLATKRGLSGYNLVVAGKDGWGASPGDMRSAAAEEGGDVAAETLITPGYIADDDLPALYRASHAYLHPALYEGFGIPPLEAMACGIPTIVSDRPALPEVVGDAALVVSAIDPVAWADILLKAASDPALCADLATRGPSRASTFTWRRTAVQTLQVYESVVGGPSAIPLRASPTSR